MRSRAAVCERLRALRGLIEAGLSEPADVRAALWGLWFAGGSGNGPETVRALAGILIGGNNPVGVLARKCRLA